MCVCGGDVSTSDSASEIKAILVKNEALAGDAYTLLRETCRQVRDNAEVDKVEMIMTHHHLGRVL